MRHSGDDNYAIERAVVKRAQERGISLTREHRAAIVAHFASRPVPDARRESGAIPKRQPPKEEAAPQPSQQVIPPPKKKLRRPAPPAPMPTPSATTTNPATGGGATSASSVADRKRKELARIEELQRQMLAAHQRIARLDFESSAAVVSAASSISMAPSLPSHPTSLPGAKGRKK